MSEETKVEETTSAPEAETKPEESKSEEDASKETTPEVEEPKVEETPEPKEEIDYEALYEAEQKARKKAEHKIVKMRAKTLEEDAPEVEETFDEKSYVDQKLQEIKYATLESRYEFEIDKVTTNPHEKKLIQLHLESNTFSGSVAEQVQKARALANYKKIARANKELAHSKSVKPGSENSSSYVKPKDNTAAVLSKLSAADVAHLKKRGLVEKYVARFG